MIRPVVFLIFFLALSATAFNVARNWCSRRGDMMMKTRRGKVPMDQRGEAIKRQRMMQQRQEVTQKMPTDVPLFDIFVRPKSGGIWLPCGSIAGDKRAASICDAWGSGFMSDMYKNTLDKGVARSVFGQEDQFVKAISENYRLLRNVPKDELEFGYRVNFKGLAEKLGDKLDKTTPLQKGMEKGWLDNVKEGFGSALADFGAKKE
mmetsp:Transcript_12334/g.12414  ORF Transcript_12334/g.12414 Transcript_12334/m.12414 type:complete len:205 (+) Transcript_12334:91-705(+)|eukprot:CAMPEP_0182428352 /NCGR_PEP_ID=MMETSP1167-20130531/22511_1 /TAXON_ID=2988 /ORGANISM="Mallomonas Sp, Strain CCMP3275" /LENGTH=204 /DNA_ID=CAMNT_0024611199 /DNA_START=88 /DNA_END=702 /DNA_ORIENTATION=+